MQELNDRIKSTENDIHELQYECHKLLSYGNVPEENWDKVYELLENRAYLKFTLRELKELKETIISNTNC